MLNSSSQLKVVLAWVSACGLPDGTCATINPQSYGASTEKVVDLDPLVIIGNWEMLDPGTMSIEGVEHPGLGRLNLAGQLADLPGLALASRGNFADEPVIRGLGFDRVATSLNGLRLPNASPTRTLAPVGQFSSRSFQTVTVSRFLPSLTSGPPVSGGRISIQSRLPEPGLSTCRKQPAFQLDAAGHPGRDGYRWQGVFEQVDGPTCTRAALELWRFGNYKSGNGIEVPSQHTSRSAAVSLHHQGDRKWHHSIDAIYRRQLFTENASLPLDTDNGQFWALTATHTLQLPQSETSLRLRYGYTEAGASLSNRRRPSAPVRVVSDTFASALHTDLQWLAFQANGNEFAWGIDANQENRNAVRQRDTVFEDAIWPDIRYRQAGTYVQSRTQFNNWLRLRLGARWDYADTEARAVDRSAFGQALVSLYSRYNGTAARDTQRTDNGFSVNALLTCRNSRALSVYVGAGTSVQIPPPTERYRAFLNSLGGGVEIGNPILSSERKQELVAGVVLTTDSLNLQVDLFAFQVDDFIWRQRIGDTAGLLPFDPPQTVFGYRNMKAAFHGIELHGQWQVSKNLYIPFSLTWNRGELKDSGLDYEKSHALPEIPPLEARIAAAYRFNIQSTRMVCHWVLRHTGSAVNELPMLNPLYSNTQSHTRHDFLFTVKQGEAITVAVSLLNIFETNYYPYLNPPTSSIRPGSGDLLPGDLIPGPGREVVFSCQFAF